MTVGERQRESERVKLLAAGNGAGEEGREQEKESKSEGEAGEGRGEDGKGQKGRAARGQVEDTKVLKGYTNKVEETQLETRQEAEEKSQAAEEMWLRG